MAFLKSSVFRGAFLLYIIGLLALSCTQAAPLINPEGYEEEVMGLSVAIKQTNRSPPTITVNVTNNNDHPITIWSAESPLGALTQELGLFRIIPEGSPKGTDLGKKSLFVYYGPPTAEDLIGIGPGGSKEQDVVIGFLYPELGEPEDEVEFMQKLGKKAIVQMTGKWHGLWMKSKEEVVAKGEVSLNYAGGGRFKSNTIELEID